jgi:hypothetical protein
VAPGTCVGIPGTWHMCRHTLHLAHVSAYLAPGTCVGIRGTYRVCRHTWHLAYVPAYLAPSTCVGIPGTGGRCSFLPRTRPGGWQCDGRMSTQHLARLAGEGLGAVAREAGAGGQAGAGGRLGISVVSVA